MDIWLVLGLGLIVYLLVSPLVLFVQTRRLTSRINELQGKLAALSGEISRLRQSGHPPLSIEEEKPTAAHDAADRVTTLEMAEGDEMPAAAVPPSGEQTTSDLPKVARDKLSESIQREERMAAPEEGASDGDQASVPESTEAQPKRGIEETLASQWMVWVGALAMGLSAVFLFRYAVDQGWLTPLFRVVLGLLIGAAILSGGEWARQKPVQALSRTMNPDLIPPILTGTGLFVIFVSLYAANALYGLLTPATAFVALGLVAYAALALSLRHGPFVALVGLSAGFAVPQLVATPDSNAAALFIYLFVLSLGCLLVMVWRKWWWFSYFTLAGALGWPVLWIFGPWTIADQGILAAYVLGLAAAFAILSTDLPVKTPDTALWRWMSAMLSDTSGLGFTLCGALLLLLAEASGFNEAAFLFLGAYGGLALILAVRRSALESLVVAAALVALATFLLWPPPASVSLPTVVAETGGMPAGNAFGPFVMPPEFLVFSRALWAFAALFGVGAFAGLWRARTPEVWAGVSAAIPTLLFVIGYWRIGAFEIDIAWGGVALGLAVVGLFAAIAVGRMPEGERRKVSLAFYAAATTAAIALAFTCVLREAWLTVAISVEVLALAWIWTRVPVGALRQLGTLLTAIVLVRLVANPLVLDYDGSVLGVFGWMLYGYGIPAAATGTAAWLFARSEVDLAVTFCEAASLAFAVLMVALQLRLWTAGSLSEPTWTLFDVAVQTVWWIAAVALLLRRTFVGYRPWIQPVGHLGLATLVFVVLGIQVFVNSPLISYEPVGDWPLINLLALAYLVPAAQFLFLGASPMFDVPADGRRILGGVGGFLIFVYLTLETRRIFWGSEISLGLDTSPTSAEIYAYSAIWIAYALSLLALGIWRHSQPLRYASLAVLLLTVAKVFVYDMSDLTGLFRVASFLGLGVSLIAIARVYQRFVFSKDAEAVAEEQ